MLDSQTPIEPIEPAQAAAVLEPKLAELTAQGWRVIIQTDYMARLTRGRANLDVRVDLLGNLEMEEKPLTDMQESGRLIAIVLLLITFLLVLTLLSGLGWLN